MLNFAAMIKRNNPMMKSLLASTSLSLVLLLSAMESHAAVTTDGSEMLAVGSGGQGTPGDAVILAWGDDDDDDDGPDDDDDDDDD
jgi:hypothetical protein